MTRDNIPIKVTAGEYVLSRPAVKRIGVKKLDRMNRKGKKGSGRAKRHFADGGLVDSQTRVDNQIADAQGAARATAPKKAASFGDFGSSQGVRPSATQATGVKKSALGKAQQDVFKSLTGMKKGGLVKSSKKSAALRRRLNGVLI